MKKTLYQILEVAPNASDEVINLAFAALPKRYHPDVVPALPDAELHYKILREAYKTLSNANSRAFYDHSLVSLPTPRETRQEVEHEVARVWKPVVIGLLLIGCWWLYHDHKLQAEKLKLEQDRVTLEAQQNAAKLAVEEELTRKRLEQDAEMRNRSLSIAEKQQMDRFRREDDYAVQQRRREEALETQRAQQLAQRERLDQERKEQQRNQQELQQVQRAKLEQREREMKLRQLEYENKRNPHLTF